MLEKIVQKKKRFILSITVLILGLWSYFSTSFGMKNYEEVDFATGIVTANVLNVRQGPGMTYKIISKVHKDDYIRIFAKIGDWYVVQTDNDIIGTVHVDYIKPIYPNNAVNAQVDNTESSEQVDNEENVQEQEVSAENTLAENFEEENVNVVVSDKQISSELTQDEKEVFDLINKSREDAGLAKLEIDDNLQNICRIKANEMVEKDYFSHTSPTYGSPFDMLKSNNIEYKVAGENIAGNSSNQKAVEAWLGSENHKKNIINNSYNYTGIAVVNSEKYGKIYVQMFIGR